MNVCVNIYIVCILHTCKCMCAYMYACEPVEYQFTMSLDMSLDNMLIPATQWDYISVFPHL